MPAGKPPTPGARYRNQFGRCAKCNASAPRTGGTNLAGKFVCAACAVAVGQKKFGRLVAKAETEGVRVITAGWIGAGPYVNYEFECAAHNHVFKKQLACAMGKRPLCGRCAAKKRTAA